MRTRVCVCPCTRTRGRADVRACGRCDSTVGMAAWRHRRRVNGPPTAHTRTSCSIGRRACSPGNTARPSTWRRRRTHCQRCRSCPPCRRRGRARSAPEAPTRTPTRWPQQLRHGASLRVGGDVAGGGGSVRQAVRGGGGSGWSCQQGADCTRHCQAAVFTCKPSAGVAVALAAPLAVGPVGVLLQNAGWCWFGLLCDWAWG